MNNMDMAKLMNMLSQMDKRELEQGLTKVAQILNSPEKDKIITIIKYNYILLYKNELICSNKLKERDFLYEWRYV